MNLRINSCFVLSQFLLLLSLAVRVGAVGTFAFRFASVLHVCRGAILSLAVAGVLSIATVGGAVISSAPPHLTSGGVRTKEAVSHTGRGPVGKFYFALGQIESGENDLAIGAALEVSRYQIKPALWRQFSSPGMSPRREADARVVVARILVPRVRDFTARAHRPPTAEEMYVLWNAPAALESRKQKAESRNKNIPAAVAERAKRFSNLFYA